MTPRSARKAGCGFEYVIGPFEAGKHICVCGPDRLTADTLAVAERLGYPPKSVHSEAAPPAPQANDIPVEIKFAKTGKSITVNPGQSILEAALSEGFQVSHSCKHGECGLGDNCTDGRSGSRGVPGTPRANRRGIWPSTSDRVQPFKRFL